MTIDNIIANNFYELRAGLAREGVDIDITDIEYNLLDRCEHIAIRTENIYPDENMPSNFGVYRGYAGGGMHASLQRTEVHKMNKRRQNKANRLLDLFENTFWKILEDIEAEASEQDPSREFWDSVKL